MLRRVIVLPLLWASADAVSKRPASGKSELDEIDPIARSEDGQADLLQVNAPADVMAPVAAHVTDAEQHDQLDEQPAPVQQEEHTQAPVEQPVQAVEEPQHEQLIDASKELPTADSLVQLDDKAEDASNATDADVVSEEDDADAKNDDEESSQYHRRRYHRRRRRTHFHRRRRRTHFHIRRRRSMVRHYKWSVDYYTRRQASWKKYVKHATKRAKRYVAYYTKKIAETQKKLAAAEKLWAKAKKVKAEKAAKAKAAAVAAGKKKKDAAAKKKAAAAKKKAAAAKAAAAKKKKGGKTKGKGKGKAKAAGKGKAKAAGKKATGKKATAKAGQVKVGRKTKKGGR